MSKSILRLFAFLTILSSCQPSKQTKEAIRYNNRAIEFSTTNLDSAIYYFDKAIATDSSYLLALQNKANLYISLGYNQEALAAVNSLASKTKNTQTYIIKGMLHDLLQERTLAMENYKIAISKIDYEIKKVNDAVKYKKLYDKGTLYLLMDKRKQGIHLITKYSLKANIANTKKDSLIQFQENKEMLLNMLLKP